MKLMITIAAMTVVLSNAAYAGDEVQPTATAVPTNDVANADFCMMAGKPPSQFSYTSLEKVVVRKGTYGPVTDILPKFVKQARELGADAIVDYSGHQGFGFWPWAMVRPVVYGTAIKWTNGQVPSCNALGGMTLKWVIETGKGPESNRPKSQNN